MAKRKPGFNFICVFIILAFWSGVFLLRHFSAVEDGLGGVLASPTSVTARIKVIVSSQAPSVESLPSQLNLPVPFTSQAPEKNWDQPWQDACEEAAVLMLDAYYKKYGLSPLFAKDEILKMVAWEEEQGFGLSIEAQKMKQLIEFYSGKLETGNLKLGTVTIVENSTVEQIKNFITEGKPVLVLADGKVLPNPHFRNGGPVYHALIIRGYTEDSFITNDPGTQFGDNYVYKYNDLMNAIHDWNGGDVKNGKRVVIVIE